MNTLASCLIAAAVAWYPNASTDQRSAQERIATATANVAHDEPPLEGRSRAWTAHALYGIAFEESGAVWARIVAGQCLKGECDGGAAFGPWQIHADEQGGIQLVGLGFRYAADKRPLPAGTRASGVLVGADLASDPELGARVALHMLRRTPKIWTLGPKGVSLGSRWLAAHPCAD